MQMYLISDNHDTLTGMRMCGVEGVRLSGRKALLCKLDMLIKEKSVGVVLITDKLHALAVNEIDEMRQRIRFPLIVSIPDRHGRKKSADFLTEYVRQAIGVNVV